MFLKDTPLARIALGFFSVIDYVKRNKWVIVVVIAGIVILILLGG